nr:unnamed protein product [Callosobruchus analis]
MLQAGWRLEASQALYLFLTRLQQPLIPRTIQSLVLDDNGNVPPEIIATDVLGLLKQELSAKHLALTSLLLNLLDTVIKVSPADELRGNTLPTSMLPLFLTYRNQHMSEWRRIATIFVEVIRQASYHLETCFPCDENNVRTFLILFICFHHEKLIFATFIYVYFFFSASNDGVNSSMTIEEFTD